VQSAGSADASLPKKLSVEAFCQAEANLYASPSQLAAMWPDVASRPSITQAEEMVNRLYAMDSPTKSLKAQIYALNIASQKQFQEATYFNPGFHVSHSRAAEVGYTTVIERSAAAIKKFLKSHARTLVSYCQDFNDTRTVEGIAVMTTNSAQPRLRASDTTARTTEILARAAKEVGHYVVFESLSVRGSSDIAHYRIAAITGMVNSCTTVPSKLPPVPVSVHC
jgi:hypothetical protein